MIRHNNQKVRNSAFGESAQRTVGALTDQRVPLADTQVSYGAGPLRINRSAARLAPDRSNAPDAPPGQSDRRRHASSRDRRHRLTGRAR